MNGSKLLTVSARRPFHLCLHLMHSLFDSARLGDQVLHGLSFIVQPLLCVLQSATDIVRYSRVRVHVALQLGAQLVLKCLQFIYLYFHFHFCIQYR